MKDRLIIIDYLVYGKIDITGNRESHICQMRWSNKQVWDKEFSCGVSAISQMLSRKGDMLHIVYGLLVLSLEKPAQNSSSLYQRPIKIWI
jgi:hypothetical protein